MSDSIDELSKQYMENVWEHHARSIGLFPIPEYPEFEAERGMWSTALDVLLTTLRYIAPATLLTLFWGQQSFLFKLLKYIDSAVRSLIFSSEEQKQTVLQWLGEAGPVRVDKLEVVWRHGWIVCGVLDAALPGACAGHPPTRLSMKHAQAIADNYLGVEPVFSRQELETNDSLSRHQEWKLINYLEKIRLSLAKLTPPTPKSANPPTQKPTTEATNFTFDYIARGSGLIAAQIKNKVYFKIYPTAQQSLDPGEINILIHGPKDTYGVTVLSPILGKAQMIRQNLLGLQSRTSYTENVLPITQGTTYLRSYGNNIINKTFYVPKTKYDIDIDVELKQDHARVGYIATLDGKYEISITSRGQHVVGSPFTVTASNNIVGHLERDSFCLEDGEEIDIVDVKTDRKAVLRIVDFVTEKMLLKENGTFEKISEEEARHLMNVNVQGPNKETKVQTLASRLKSKDRSKLKSNKFYHIAHKVLNLNRICRIFQNFGETKPLFKISGENSKNKQDIPYIHSSTIYESQIKSHSLLENRNRIIIPKNISVSLVTEKPKAYVEENKLIDTFDINVHTHGDSLVNFDILKVDALEDDTISVDTVQSSNNPFANDMCDRSYTIEKGFGSFITNEYETHNSQNEETENLTKKLLINRQFDSNNQNVINPFIDINELERPKTPVYKIITGEVTNRNDSIYIKTEEAFLTDDNISNSLPNPFFKHELETTDLYQEKPDFIIGAPVSLPPVNFIPTTISTKTNIEITTRAEKKNKSKEAKEITPNIHAVNFSSKSSSIETKTPIDDYSSLDSNSTQDIIIIPRSIPTPTTISHSQTSRETSPKKDTWDSAYVSIDDTNVLLENNSSEVTNDTFIKRKSPLSEEITKMGPAEKEIWQCDSELKDINYIPEDHKLYKCDLKRHEFTPIIEENERNITSFIKEDTHFSKADNDSVAETFTELSDIFNDKEINSEKNSVTTTQDNKLQNLGIDYSLEGNDIRVDSASEILTDVKRQANKLEGKISEVQVNATESFSVSQNLHVKVNEHYQEQNNNDEIQFGDRIYSNIVLEKKKYWDDKIRQIEAKSEEIRLLQNKRRLSSKQLRRDSISKRKGKKIVQHLLKSGHEIYTKSTSQSSELSNPHDCIEKVKILKNKRDELDKYDLTCWGRKTEMSEKEPIIDTLKDNNDNTFEIDSIDSQKGVLNFPLQLKQEVPEKVFQAFETSPKRFFGTSRKHILNKIDTFIESPDIEKEIKQSTLDMYHESGLVSSRISLFHNISQTEELPYSRRKFKSMHNVSHEGFPLQQINSSKSIEQHDNIPNKNEPLWNLKMSLNNQNQDNHTLLKKKRARLIQNKNNRSFDDTLCSKHNENEYVKNVIKDLNNQSDSLFQSSANKLKSISKSEMDIFNKATTTINEDLEKHKSYEELPKISVKNFISLYEDVSKTTNKTSPVKVFRNMKPNTESSNRQVPSSTQGTTNKANTLVIESPILEPSSSISTDFEYSESPRKTKQILTEDITKISIYQSDSLDSNVISSQDKETNYLSLSDIEIEIVDKDLEKKESSPKIETSHLEYKHRFTKAKQFFQSLEELREDKTSKKLSAKENFENMSNESLENSKQPRKKSNIKKSHSMPSSEISKVWNQMQEQKEENKKLVKISEKFNVDDLFEDVMEGRLSRQGSLRGIPHKKAVLETFKSMENITDCKLNSYEMAESQLNDFAKDNKIRNAQTYLTEYPYLPTTDPSKYHSRLDINASGLITFKELKKIPRRNSVPDLRLNTKFTADL